jgi:creatinine amidohydrolase
MAGTASISAGTLYAIVNDVYTSVVNSSVISLVILNGHGGNYVLANVVQEGSAQGKKVALFPTFFTPTPNWSGTATSRRTGS